MKHKYIEPDLVKKFNKKKTLNKVIKDITEKYKITNIYDDEIGRCCWLIANALYNDYIIGRANYEAYIEVGMDARMLMELRKSAVFFIEEGDSDYFYTGLRNCETWEEVREFRKRFFQRINPDYIELYWQYYFLVNILCGKYSKDFLFDYEACFADGDISKQTNIEDYRREALNAHLPEYLRREK